MDHAEVAVAATLADHVVEAADSEGVRCQQFALGSQRREFFKLKLVYGLVNFETRRT